MRFLLRVLMVGLAFVPGGLAQDETDPVVLRVNGEEMLLSEFNERFTFYANNLAAQQGMPPSPPQDSAAKIYCANSSPKVN
jgi:hypothetical protein